MNYVINFYFNMIFYLILSIGFSFLIAGICQLLTIFLYKHTGFLTYEMQKINRYECGFDPFSGASDPIEIKFYLIAVLFLIFDLEIIILLPLLSSIFFITILESIIIVFFLIILIIGFFYEWEYGCLNW